MAAGEEFNWRLEEACAAAWPARTTLVHGGWLLKADGGSVRRSNSVNPLRGPRVPPGEIVPVAEQLYRERRQMPIFRVPEIADDLQVALEGRGYVEHAPTLTLAADLVARRPAVSVRLAAAPDDRWLAARGRIGGFSEGDQVVYAGTVGGLLVPACFASVEVEGEIAAQSFGAIHRGALVLESVATDPAHRGRGLAGGVVDALIGWAIAAGAEIGCLQVLDGNEAALRLYRSRGFGRLAYRYHYRIPGDA